MLEQTRVDMIRSVLVSVLVWCQIAPLYKKRRVDAALSTFSTQATINDLSVDCSGTNYYCGPPELCAHVYVHVHVAAQVGGIHWLHN